MNVNQYRRKVCLSAALRGAKNLIGTLSPGCAALHPGLFSRLPDGMTAVEVVLALTDMV